MSGVGPSVEAELSWRVVERDGVVRRFELQHALERCGFTPADAARVSGDARIARDLAKAEWCALYDALLETLDANLEAAIARSLGALSVRKGGGKGEGASAATLATVCAKLDPASAGRMRSCMAELGVHETSALDGAALAYTLRIGLEESATSAKAMDGAVEGRLAEAISSRAGAEGMWIDRLRSLEARHGPAHPDTVAAAMELAALLDRGGESAQAEVLLRHALRTREASLGRAHADVLECVERLGLSHGSLGFFESAGVLLARAAGAHCRAVASEPATAERSASAEALARLTWAQRDLQRRGVSSEPSIRTRLSSTEEFPPPTPHAGAFGRGRPSRAGSSGAGSPLYAVMPSAGGGRAAGSVPPALSPPRASKGESGTAGAESGTAGGAGGEGPLVDTLDVALERAEEVHEEDHHPEIIVLLRELEGALRAEGRDDDASGVARRGDEAEAAAMQIAIASGRSALRGGSQPVPPRRGVQFHLPELTLLEQARHAGNVARQAPAGANHYCAALAAFRRRLLPPGMDARALRAANMVSAVQAMGHVSPEDLKAVEALALVERTHSVDQLLSTHKLGPITGDLSHAELRGMAVVCRVNHGLREVILAGCVSDARANLLSEALHMATGLDGLHIVGINTSTVLGARGAHLLAPALGRLTCLRKLDLHRNNLQGRGVRELLPALRHLRALTDLQLWSNRVDTAGAQALAEALPGMSALRFLGLQDNILGDLGAAALCPGLAKCALLTSLDLSNNGIHAAGVEAVAGALEGTPALATLLLQGNSIGDSGAKALAKPLPSLVKLRTLALHGADMNIGREGERAIVDALDRMTGTLDVTLEGSATEGDSVHITRGVTAPSSRASGVEDGDPTRSPAAQRHSPLLPGASTAASASASPVEGDRSTSGGGVYGRRRSQPFNIRARSIYPRGRRR